MRFPYRHFTDSIENYFNMMKPTKITKFRWIEIRELERKYTSGGQVW